MTEDPRTDGPPAAAPRGPGAFVAVDQLAGGWNPVRLVAIEEPEPALDPAAAGAPNEAAVHTLVVGTTHSPDLLDQTGPESDRPLAVERRGGDAVAGPANRATREAIQERLFFPVERPRPDRLEPGPTADVNGARPRPTARPPCRPGAIDAEVSERSRAAGPRTADLRPRG